MDAKTVLLEVLAQEPGYGLQLIERVIQHTHGKLVLRGREIYPALRELERDKLLESYRGESRSPQGGQPPRYYRLTEKGAKVLAELQETRGPG
jgi:PadR family transcriptional regulator, regulatory protein PadR